MSENSNNNILSVDKQKKRLFKYLGNVKELFEYLNETNETKKKDLDFAKEIMNKFLENKELSSVEESYLGYKKKGIVELFLKDCAKEFNDDDREFGNFLVEKFGNFYFTYCATNIGILCAIIKNNNYELIKFLIDNIPYNENNISLNVTLLYCALMETKNYNMFDFLIAKGININLEFGDKTLLMIVTNNMDYEAVEYLVKKGADVDIKDYNNNTAFDLLLSTIIDKVDPDCNIISEKNKEIITEKFLKIAKCLLEKKTNINLTENEIEIVLKTIIKYCDTSFEFLINSNIKLSEKELMENFLFLVKNNEIEVLKVFFKKESINFLVNTKDFIEAFKVNNNFKKEYFKLFFKFLLDTVIYSNIPLILTEEEVEILMTVNRLLNEEGQENENKDLIEILKEVEQNKENLKNLSCKEIINSLTKNEIDLLLNELKKDKESTELYEKLYTNYYLKNFFTEDKKEQIINKLVTDFEPFIKAYIECYGSKDFEEINKIYFQLYNYTINSENLVDNYKLLNEFYNIVDKNEIKLSSGEVLSVLDKEIFDIEKLESEKDKNFEKIKTESENRMETKKNETKEKLKEENIITEEKELIKEVFKNVKNTFEEIKLTKTYRDMKIENLCDLTSKNIKFIKKSKLIDSPITEEEKNELEKIEGTIKEINYLSCSKLNMASEFFKKEENILLEEEERKNYINNLIAVSEFFEEEKEKADYLDKLEQVSEFFNSFEMTNSL